MGLAAPRFNWRMFRMSTGTRQMQQRLATESIVINRTGHINPIVAGAIGNGLEWFNFGANVLYAAIIAKQFFSHPTR